MCLTDNNFKNLPAGDVVDKFIKELKHDNLIGTTDSLGHFQASLYHGDYEAKINHPAILGSSSAAMKFKVAPTIDQDILNFKLSSINVP